MRIHGLALLTILSLVSQGASAALFCVGTPAQLQAALDVAASNGEPDSIRVVGGTYVLNAPLTLSTSEPLTVSVSGRWNSNCTAQNGSQTVLDGQGQVQVLSLASSTNTGIGISQLSIANGYQATALSSAAGAALQSYGNVVVEDCIFFNNRDDNNYAGGLAIYVGGDADLTVRSNVFLANQSTQVGAADLFGNGSNAYVVGNTVVANSRSQTLEIGGFFLRGTAAFVLSNNILWNNTGGDLYNGSNIHPLLLHNDIGVAAGNPEGAGSTGNFNRDPQFAPGQLNLRLSSHSPLVNGGLDGAPGNIGDTDVTGAPRLEFPHVDIGAYETDVIFFGGFEAP